MRNKVIHYLALLIFLFSQNMLQNICFSNEAPSTLKKVEAPILNKFEPLTINVFDLITSELPNIIHDNSEESQRFSIKIDTLIKYMESRYAKKQFIYPDFQYLQRPIKNVGLAITHMNSVEGLEIYISGVQSEFINKLGLPDYNEDIALLIEPEHELTFLIGPNFKNPSEIKFNFKLWSLEGREQVSGSREYRLKFPERLNSFSANDQIITLKLDLNLLSNPIDSPPVWVYEKPTLYKINNPEANEIQGIYIFPIDEILKDTFGEFIIRDKENGPLGACLSNINTDIGAAFFRSNRERDDWTPIPKGAKNFCLSTLQDFRFEMHSPNIQSLNNKHLMDINGWDGKVLNAQKAFTHKKASVYFKLSLESSRVFIKKASHLLIETH